MITENNRLDNIHSQLSRGPPLGVFYRLHMPQTASQHCAPPRPSLTADTTELLQRLQCSGCGFTLSSHLRLEDRGLGTFR